MAGDWLPIRYTLPECPKVARVAQIVSIDSDSVVGKLVRLWRWFGEHTTGGMSPLCPRWFDDNVVFCAGFMSACAHPDVCFATIIDDRVTLPYWDKWNSKASKKRLKEREKKRKEREKKRPDSVPILSRFCPDSVPLVPPLENRGENRGENRAATAPLPPTSGVGEDESAAAVSLLVAKLREFGVSESGIGMVLKTNPLPSVRFAGEWWDELAKRRPHVVNPPGMLVKALSEKWTIPDKPSGESPRLAALMAVADRRNKLFERASKGDKRAMKELRGELPEGSA